MEKYITGYEGLYLITDSGEVISDSRKFNLPNGGVRSLDRKIMRLNTDKDGYKTIILSKNGKTKTLKVHRLVLETFIGPNNLKPIVNHKNGNRADNSISNLEWVTTTENNLYSYKVLGRISATKGLLLNGTKVCQIDPNNKQIIAVWSSMTEAGKFLQIPYQNISRACRQNKKAGGYYWRYQNQTNEQSCSRLPFI